MREREVVPRPATSTDTTLSVTKTVASIRERVVARNLVHLWRTTYVCSHITFCCSNCPWAILQSLELVLS